MDRSDFVSEEAWQTYKNWIANTSSRDPAMPAVPQMPMATTLMDIRTALAAEQLETAKAHNKFLWANLEALLFALWTSALLGVVGVLVWTRYVSGA
jgi:hypothetical protein